MPPKLGWAFIRLESHHYAVTLGRSLMCLKPNVHIAYAAVQTSSSIYGENIFKHCRMFNFSSRHYWIGMKVQEAPAARDVSAASPHSSDRPRIRDLLSPDHRKRRHFRHHALQKRESKGRKSCTQTLPSSVQLRKQSQKNVLWLATAIASTVAQYTSFVIVLTFSITGRGGGRKLWAKGCQLSATD